MIDGIAAKIADAAVAVSVVRTRASAPPPDDSLPGANQAKKPTAGLRRWVRGGNPGFGPAR